MGVLGQGEGLLWTSLSVSVQQNPLRETGSLAVKEECCLLSERMRANLVINGSDGDIWVRKLVRAGLRESRGLILPLGRQRIC